MTLPTSISICFYIKWLCFLWIVSGCNSTTPSQRENADTIIYADTSQVLSLNQGVSFLKATSPTLIDDIIISKKFKFTNGEIQTLQPGSYWFKFSLKNNSSQSLLKIELSHPQMDTADLYVVSNGNIIKVFHAGNFRRDKFTNNTYHQNPTYNIPLNKDEVVDCYIYASSRSFIICPLFIGNTEQILSKQNLQDMLFCIYLGTFLSMIFYNLFIYTSTRDKMYLLYVAYAIMITLSQLTLFGYGYRFILPDTPEVSYWLYSITGALVGTAAALFIESFLEIKKYSYRLFIAVRCIAYLFLLHFILDILGFYYLREIVYDILGLTGCILFYICVITANQKGNTTAKYLFAGWSIFFFGHIMFILKNEGILPYNWITNFSLTAGTAIETILLSFALADRINTLRKDNDKKQKEIIKYLEANEQYLKISKKLAIDAERLKKEILIAEFETLKNQVNPHFLFNSLNVLSDLVYEDRTMQ
ncbi:MAG: histidine kinase [Sporocytophaga sp.]|nr:histidine kinase [Sporocytophaga sp.]